MRYLIILALLAASCKKQQCYTCTTHYQTQSTAPPPGKQMLCDMSAEQIAAHEKANTGTTNGLSRQTHCEIE